MSKMTLFGRFRLGLGKLRRTYLHTLHRGYIRRNLARRTGECARCGACCKLMFTCPYLDTSGQKSACTRHHMRWWNCKIFPVDERDLKDRDMIHGHGACGYHFDPPLPPQRWLALLLAVSLGLCSIAGNARAASRPEQNIPAVVQSSFRGERLPSGWWVDGGEWECARGGLSCITAGRISGALREHAQPVKNVDVTIEVWGAFTGRAAAALSAALAASPSVPEEMVAAPPALSITWGDLTAGLEQPRLSSVFATFGEAPVVTLPANSPDDSTTTFHFTVDFAHTVAKARTAADQEVVARDIYGTSLNTSVKRVVIGAASGTVIHAVRIEMAPRTAQRNHGMALADEARTSGDVALAMTQYVQLEGERGALSSLRAEAAFKRAALHWRAGERREAIRAWEIARTFDSAGPWGERSCLALAHAAVEAGRPAVAFRLAGDLVDSNAPRIEEWQSLQDILVESVHGMEETGVASQASFGLERIAERLQWSHAPARYTAWAWDLVAASYRHRGYDEQAAVAHRMATRFRR
jgi:hypothetical protein